MIGANPPRPRQFPRPLCHFPRTPLPRRSKDGPLWGTDGFGSLSDLDRGIGSFSGFDEGIGAFSGLGEGTGAFSGLFDSIVGSATFVDDSFVEAARLPFD